LPASKQRPPIDPVASFEQRFAFRIYQYLANDRNADAEFTLAGLRGWMICQTWSDPPASPTLECLAVLSWTMIRQIEAVPAREPELRRELGRQLDFLDGSSAKRPASLDVALARSARAGMYANLRDAAGPGSARRQSLGMPRFPVDERSA